MFLKVIIVVFNFYRIAFRVRYIFSYPLPSKINICISFWGTHIRFSLRANYSQESF